jgi:hypothetical protein
MYYLKRNLRFLNDTLKCYFTFKFLTFSVPFKLPKVNKNSRILTKELLALFYLSNTYFQSTETLKGIYLAIGNEISYSKICKALFDFKGPTLILIQHEDSDADQKKYIIGGFNSLPWHDSFNYQGSKDSYIFSLLPSFRNYFPDKHATSVEHYCFLSNENNDSNNGIRKGIGY